MWPTFKFWDTLHISGYKLQIWYADSLLEELSKKCKIRGKGGVAQFTLPTFKLWDPVYISGTAAATNFKFGIQVHHREYYQKNAKLMDKRDRGLGHVTYV